MKTNKLVSIDIRGVRPDDGTTTATLTLENHTETIQLTTTRCHYGNVRYWFLCPRCDGRVAVLYFNRWFGCRKCFELVYPIENEPKADRAIRRADAIRKQLGWRVGELKGTKPKYLHWQTFNKLVARHDKYMGGFFSVCVIKYALPVTQSDIITTHT